MTDDEICNAACEAYEAADGYWWQRAEAVYRAGMAAEHDRCIAIAQGELFDTPSGIRTVAYLRAYNDGVWAVIARLKATHVATAPEKAAADGSGAAVAHPDITIYPECSDRRRREGQSYARPCFVCGLGPCRDAP